MEEDNQELQLLPTPYAAASSSHAPSVWPSYSSSIKFRPKDSFEGPSLDLELSISVRPIRPPDYNNTTTQDPSCSVEALKWQAAEQIRLAAIEKAYAERVRELTRSEMELAQSEFARARGMCERAQEEVEKAERMKERATRWTDSTCMEITCQSCRQKFRP